MAKKLQHPDLTHEEFEFELRDHRAMAYNEYIRFQDTSRLCRGSIVGRTRS